MPSETRSEVLVATMTGPPSLVPLLPEVYPMPSDRLDRYDPRRRLPPPALLERIHTKRLGFLREFSVWLVDGELIRNHLDTDFVLGGNPARYRYVPADELWVERLWEKEPTDLAPTVVHEYLECVLMRDRGYTYSQGHDAACDIEKELRSRISASPPHLSTMALTRACLDYVGL